MIEGDRFGSVYYIKTNRKSGIPNEASIVTPAFFSFPAGSADALSFLNRDNLLFVCIDCIAADFPFCKKRVNELFPHEGMRLDERASAPPAENLFFLFISEINGKCI